MALSIAENKTTSTENFTPYKQTQFALDAEIDFTDTDNQVGENKSIKLFTQPADTRISKVFYAVRTAEGGTLTFDIGVGSVIGDEDNIVDGANGNSVATLAVVHPAFDVVSSDADILLTIRDAAAAAKIYVQVELTQSEALY